MRARSSLRKQTMLVRVTLSAYFYVAQAVERALALAFVNKLILFESHYRHILCSLDRWMRARSSLRKQTVCSSPTIGILLNSRGRWTQASSSLRKQSMLVRVPLSAYFYVPQADECGLVLAFVNKLFVRVPVSAYFYVVQADEPAQAVVFVNKICGFDSQYRHIFM